MFCKNCGKDIGDAKFCQYCGNLNDGTSAVTVNVVQKDVLTTLNEKINKIGQGKLIKIILLISAVINILIRVFNNVIETVRSGLFSQDDYFVASGKSVKYMIIVMVVSVILSLLLCANAKREKARVGAGTIVMWIIWFVILILVMVLRVPAPY